MEILWMLMSIHWTKIFDSLDWKGIFVRLEKEIHWIEKEDSFDWKGRFN